MFTFLEAGFSFLATFQSIGATIPEAAVPFLQHIALGNHHLDIVSLGGEFPYYCKPVY